MKTTEVPKRYGRKAPMKEERNRALPAAPAATANGSTGRQQVAAARILPTADIAAANAPLEGDFGAVGIASVFMDAEPSVKLLSFHRSS
jgi:hypothetical protein